MGYTMNTKSLGVAHQRHQKYIEYGFAIPRRTTSPSSSRTHRFPLLCCLPASHYPSGLPTFVIIVGGVSSPRLLVRACRARGPHAPRARPPTARPCRTPSAPSAPLGARLRRGGRPGGLMMRVPRGRPSVGAAAGTLVERGNFKERRKPAQHPTKPPLNPPKTPLKPP